MGSITLTNGTHYSLSYSDNIDQGYATITVSPKNTTNFTGSKNKSFMIVYAWLVSTTNLTFDEIDLSSTPNLAEYSLDNQTYSGSGVDTQFQAKVGAGVTCNAYASSPNCLVWPNSACYSNSHLTLTANATNTIKWRLKSLNPPFGMTCQKSSSPTKTLRIEMFAYGSAAKSASSSSSTKGSTETKSLNASNIKYNSEATKIDCEDAQCALDKVNELIGE